MAYTYCSYEDVMQKISVADNGFDTVTYNTATVAPHQENAENTINAALQGYYVVPFTGTIPLVINELCALITAVEILNIVYGLDTYEINKTVGYFQKKIETTIKKLQTREWVLPARFSINAKQYFIGNEIPYFDFEHKDWEDLE